MKDEKAQQPIPTVEEPKKDEPKLTTEEQLKKQLEEAQKTIEEMKSKYLLALADFENYRKRMLKEIEETRDKAVANFVLDLLPAIDNFEMSLKMSNNPQMFVRGVEMIHKNLTETLKEHHFESYETKIGDHFDTLKHDPLPLDKKDAQPGKVLTVLTKGYKHKQNILRPAKVQIKKED